MRIGLITDTHLPGQIRDLSDLGPLPEKFLSSVDLIIQRINKNNTIVLDLSLIHI